MNLQPNFAILPLTGPSIYVSNLPDDYQRIKIDFENLKDLRINSLEQRQKLELVLKAINIIARISVLKEKETGLTKKNLEDLRDKAEAFQREVGKAAGLPEYEDLPINNYEDKPLLDYNRIKNFYDF